MASVEDIICQMKPNGTFQILLTVIMCLLHGPAIMSLWLTNFIAVKSPRRCAINSTICLSNQTYNDDQICPMNRTEWEYVASPESTITVFFDTQCSGMWTAYLATSSLFIGWAIGSAFISYIADRHGRKYVVFPSLLVTILFGFLSIFSPNIYVFIILRFIIGFFISGNVHLLLLFVGEFVDSKVRPTVINVIFVTEVIWVSLLCLAAYLINDWKVLAMVTTLPFFVGFLFYKFVPETLHWLQAHDRFESFKEVLEKISYWNKVNIPNNFDFEAIERYDERASKSNILDVFCTWDLFWQSLRLCCAWFTTTILYYGISMSAENFTGSFYRDFFIIIALEVPAAPFAAYLCERLGRKKTAWGSTFVASVCCITVVFIPEDGTIRFIRLALGVVGKFSITITYNTLFIWTMELYGTEIRGSAVGVCNIASKIGGASAPWIAKGLTYYSKMTSFLVMGILGVIGGCLAITLSETKGRELKTVSEYNRNNVGAHTNIGLDEI